MLILSLPQNLSWEPLFFYLLHIGFKSDIWRFLCHFLRFISVVFFSHAALDIMKCICGSYQI